MSIIQVDESRFNPKFIGPIGVRDPDIYFVLCTPEQETSDSELKRSIDIVHAAAAELGVTKYRVYYNVPYVLKMYNGVPIKLKQSDVDKYKIFIEKDIRKNLPKKIVCLGNKSTWALLPEEITSKSVKELSSLTDLDYLGIPLQVTYHPRYLLRQGGTNSSSWPQFLSHINRSFKSIDDSKEEILADKVKIFTVDQIDEFLEPFWKEPRFTLDYEANFENPLSEKHRLAGVGLGTTEYAHYLGINHLLTAGDQIELVKEKLAKFIEDADRRSAITVFCQRYELAVTLNQFGVEMNNVTDAMQTGLALNYKGSLKTISQIHLGVDLWTKDVDTWNSSYKDLLLAIRPTKTLTRPEYTRLEENNSLLFTVGKFLRFNTEEATDTVDVLYSYEEIIDIVLSLILIGESPDSTVEFRENLNSRETKFYNAVVNLFKLASNYYSDLKEVDKFLAHKVLAALEVKSYVSDYTTMPLPLVGTYCGLDCILTSRLQINKIETLTKEKQLEKASRYYNEHGRLATELELSGIQWDDEKATVLAELYETTARIALQQLLLDNRKVFKLSSVDIIAIKSATELGPLMSYCNPRASTPESRALFSSILVTPRLRVALLFNNLKSIISDNEDHTSEYPILLEYMNGYTSRTSKISELVHSYEALESDSSKDELKKKIIDLCGEVQKYTESLVTALTEADIHNYTTQELKLLTTYTSWKLESTASWAIEQLYEAITGFLGVQIDIRETWTQEMTNLYHFRLFKKVSKSRSTYINGSVGRGSVYIVDKEKLQSTTCRMVPRKEPYGVRELRDGEVYLYQSDYFPNAVATKRWSSGSHTIPWNCELRDIQIPRYKDGFLVHWDYSQMEVRILAVMSGDEALLEAYRQKKDIHRVVASKIWNKPEEEITSAERRYSKMGTFSIIYGKTALGFATDFLGGDVDRAKQLFDSFFLAFPKISAYIEESHKMCLEHGEVPTLWGDTLVIDYDRTNRRAANAAMRQSQNYRIQGTASNIAGVCINRVASWVRENNTPCRPYEFTHDAGGIDAHPDYVFDIIDILPPLSETFPQKEWGVPVEIDIEIGISGNQMIELHPGTNGESRIYIKDGMEVIDTHFDGPKDAVEEVCNRLRRVGYDVECEITHEYENYTSMKELFITRRAYSDAIGKSITTTKGILKAQRPRTRPIIELSR